MNYAAIQTDHCMTDVAAERDHKREMQIDAWIDVAREIANERFIEAASDVVADDDAIHAATVAAVRCIHQHDYAIRFRALSDAIESARLRYVAKYERAIANFYLSRTGTWPRLDQLDQALREYAA